LETTDVKEKKVWKGKLLKLFVPYVRR
jgi:hypothetical protein